MLKTKTTNNSHKSQQLLDLGNARHPDQIEYMQEIIDSGECPFCWKNLKKFQKEPVEWASKYWAVTKNHWPYTHTKVHQLIILKRHVETVTELNKEEWAELQTAINWVIEKYEMVGGGVAIRFGNTDYSGGSVAHLHLHLIQPDINHPQYSTKPVRVKIGKVPK